MDNLREQIYAEEQRLVSNLFVIFLKLYFTKYLFKNWYFYAHDDINFLVNLKMIKSE